MLIVYFITITGFYPVFPENIVPGYLYYDETLLPPEIYNLPAVALADVLEKINVIRTIGKTLTMMMCTLFFCESFLVYQIRRPNKSLIKSLIEDRNKFMFVLIGVLFFIFIALLYIPGVQVFLAESWHINFMFMFLTGLDWLVCFLISLVCIVSFEIVKYIWRRKNISF